MLTTIIGALHVYPVKSCKGISLQEAVIGKRGILYDRDWMIVDRNGKFVSQRTLPALAAIETSLTNDRLYLCAPGMAKFFVHLIANEASKLRVKVWDDVCSAYDEGEEAEDWLSVYLGKHCRLVRMTRHHERKAKQGDSFVGFADAYPFLVISEASLHDLNRRIAKPLSMDRFRPNIVLHGTEAYEEDSICEMNINSVVLHGEMKCARCLTTTVEQARGIRDGDEPLRTLATYRRTKNGVVFGRNFSHTGRGIIHVGDVATILQG